MKVKVERISDDKKGIQKEHKSYDCLLEEFLGQYCNAFFLKLSYISGALEQREYVASEDFEIDLTDLGTLLEDRIAEYYGLVFQKLREYVLSSSIDDSMKNGIIGDELLSITELEGVVQKVFMLKEGVFRSVENHECCKDGEEVRALIKHLKSLDELKTLVVRFGTKIKQEKVKSIVEEDMVIRKRLLQKGWIFTFYGKTEKEFKINYKNRNQSVLFRKYCEKVFSNIEEDMCQGIQLNSLDAEEIIKRKLCMAFYIMFNGDEMNYHHYYKTHKRCRKVDISFREVILSTKVKDVNNEVKKISVSETMKKIEEKMKNCEDKALSDMLDEWTEDKKFFVVEMSQKLVEDVIQKGISTNGRNAVDVIEQLEEMTDITMATFVYVMYINFVEKLPQLVLVKPKKSDKNGESLKSYNQSMNTVDRFVASFVRFGKNTSWVYATYWIYNVIEMLSIILLGKKGKDAWTIFEMFIELFNDVQIWVENREGERPKRDMDIDVRNKLILEYVNDTMVLGANFSSSTLKSKYEQYFCRMERVAIILKHHSDKYPEI